MKLICGLWAHWRHALWVLVCGALTPWACAAEFPLQTHYSLASFSSPEEALAGFHRGQFAALPAAPAQLGWSQRPVWLLTQPQQPWSDLKPGVLTLGPMPVASLEAWRVEADTGALQRLGVAGVTAQPVLHATPLPGLATLALDSATGRQRVLLRVQPAGLTVIDLFATETQQHADFTYMAGLIIGLLLCYSLIYWAVSIPISMMTDLWFVLWWTVLMSLCGLLLGTLNGWMPLSLPGADPRLPGWLLAALVAALLMLLTGMMLPVLEISQYLPRWSVPLTLSVAAFVPAAFLGEALVDSALVGVLMWHAAQTLLMLYVGWRRWSALILEDKTTACSALVLVLALWWLYASLLGVLELSWIVFYGWQVAIVIGMLYALTMALSGNFSQRRFVQHQRDQLHQRVLDEKQQLELRVLARTAELQDALSEVQRFESQQRELLSLASHEFRTPAAIIKSSLDVVDGLPHSVSEAAEPFMESVRVASGRLIFLANKLIEHDRWREMSLKPKMERLELCTWVAEVVGDVPKGQHVVAELCPAPVHVEADNVLLRIALQNLIDNALAHNQRVGQVTVRLRLAGTHAELIVDDQGKGVPDANKPQVFERFFSERSGQSHGLGLSIVRAVARLHGGDASVADAPGGGARFVISLPRPIARAP